MGLRKTESEVRRMLGDAILAMCSSSLDCKHQITVEGFLAVTIDHQEVILVPVNKRMKVGRGKEKVFSSHTRPFKSTPLYKTSPPQFYSSERDASYAQVPGKRKRKMTWKMRESMSANDRDHDYTSSTQPGEQQSTAKKRKKQQPGEDGEEDNEGVSSGDDSEADHDESVVGFHCAGMDSDTSHDYSEVSTPKSGRHPTPRGAKGEPRPGTSQTDPDLIESLSVANLEQQLNSTAEDLLQGAQEVVGEVVETEDGELVIKLGEMQPPLVNSQGIPFDIGQTSGQAHYRVIKGGTSMGRDMLTDGLGYSYAISRAMKPSERKDSKVGGNTTYWRCSVRASAQQRLNGAVCCTASVVERDGEFKRGETPHCHPPKEDLHARLLIGKMVREKARMLENLSIPSSHIFNEAVMTVMAEDPSVTYQSLEKYKSLFERRFNRARKECISSKTKIPNIGIRHLVRATQQHMREEKKNQKQAELQQQAEMQQEEQLQSDINSQLQVLEQTVQEEEAPILEQQVLQDATAQDTSSHDQGIHQQIQLQPQRVQIIVTGSRPSLT